MRNEAFLLKPPVPTDISDLKQGYIKQQCTIRTLNHQISQMEDEICEERRRHQVELREAVRNALVDRKCPVTGLYTRDKYDNELPHQIDMVRRYKTSFALVSVDLKDFKTVNDTYGHHVGDLMLTKLGSILLDSFRKTDFVMRWGGDEFSILMLHADAQVAEYSCDRLRTRVAEQFHVVLDDNTVVRGGATIAYGVCTPALTECTLFTQRAFEKGIDIALYRAKETGHIEQAHITAQEVA